MINRKKDLPNYLICNKEIITTTTTKLSLDIVILTCVCVFVCVSFGLVNYLNRINNNNHNYEDWK